MPIELNKSFPTARKEHKCSWCGDTIKVGEKYERSTLIYDGEIYDWLSHLECRELTSLLDMFDNDMCDGINCNDFEQCLQDWLYEHHYNDETDTYDEGFDTNKLSYHDIVLNVIKELKSK